MAAASNAKAQFPEKLAFLFEPARYKVAYGGRGAAKSWSIARALLILAAQQRLRVLCTRELQGSIQDSVHKLLKEQIEALGFGQLFDVQQSTIRAANGSEFIFTGIRSNVTKIKSMEGIDICWVEEAEKVSAESWDILVPTIRKAGSEIWVSFNPHDEKDPTYQRFVVKPPPTARVVEVGWQDNPWLPRELKAELEYLQRVDPEAFDHVYGGKPRKFGVAQILRGRWSVEPFEPNPSEWGGPYYGADWGYASDPLAFVRCWVHGRTLYVEHEAYGVGVEIVETPKKFDEVPGGREHASRADNARPEMIGHMNANGYPRMEAAIKGPGSVEHGIEHLRSYERIVIHPRCKHTATEARLWSWKVDKLTGDVLPVPVDKHNHCWDAIRYALEPIIRKSTVVGVPGDEEGKSTWQT